MSRARRALWLATALALLASCGSDDGPGSSGAGGASGSGPDGVAVASVDRSAARPELAPEVVAATNRFAVDLYALAAEGADNLAFSPLSIAIALSMTSEAARGTSWEQLEAVLRVSEVDDPHGGWNALDQALASRAGTVGRDDGSTDELALAVVNQLWAQAGFPVEEPFLTVAAASYGAGVNLVDFATDPEQAREAINAWVAGRTEDRIPELIPEGVITDLTRLVLTNAVYFKAPWASPFDPRATRDGAFTLLDGSTVDTPLMSTEGAFATRDGDGWQAVQLAYAGEELELVLLVPDTGRFAEVEARLGAGLLDEVPTGMARQRQALTMPSFEVRTPLPLKSPLQALGMPDPFDPDVADFSGVNAALGHELYIQDVVHEAFVAVDETGTEAAAATAVVIGVESAGPPPITVDRPFLWAIRDVPTGAVLFLGRIVDPTIPA